MNPANVGLYWKTDIQESWKSKKAEYRGELVGTIEGVFIPAVLAILRVIT